MFKRFENKGIITFVVILFLCSIFFSSLILDYTLTTRFFLLSFLLTIFLLSYRFSYQTIVITLIHLSFLAFCYISFLTVFWALNPAETWFVVIKTFCSIVVFFCSLHFFIYNPKSLTVISKAASYIVFIAIAISYIQLNEISLFHIQLANNENPLYYVTSINSHKNLLSSFLFILLPFVIIKSFRTKTDGFVPNDVFVIATFVLLYVLKTRTVLIACFCTAFIFTSFFIYIGSNRASRKQLKIVAVDSIGIISILLFIIMYKVTKYTSLSSFDNADSLIERVLIWKNTVKMIGEHFWFGVGAGNWQIFFPKYSLNGIWRCDEMNVTFQRPHNDFLWIWSEFGFVGFILKMIVFVGVTFPAFRKIRSKNISNDQKYETALFLSFYISLVIIMAFDFPMERAEHTIWISIMMAYLYSSNNDYFKPLFTFRYTRIVSLFAAILLLFSSYVCYLKIKGEYLTKKMYEAKQQNEYQQVVKYGTMAESFVYTLDPVSMPLSWYCGNAFASMQKYDKAMNCFEKANTQHPYNRYVLNDLATSYVLKEDYKHAEQLYIRAAKISRRYDDATLNLIALYIQTNQIEKAKGWDTLLCHDSPRRTYLKHLLMK